MISMDKQYKTRDGQTIKILHILNHGPFPVIGIRKTEDHKETLSMWTINGSFWNTHVGESKTDLVEVKKEHTKIGWINIYKNGSDGIYTSKFGADTNESIHQKRIACKEITFTYTEGEGL